MNELLRDLSREAHVLDLGSGGGSFSAAGREFIVVRLDLEPPVTKTSNFVQADAAQLPFAAGLFDVIVSNNSLEHVEDLAGCLQEIGRAVKPDGALYIAVPDAATITDKLYRWLARGGGHVNQFYSAGELALLIERAIGLKHSATRTLCTSLSFLNRKNRRSPAPKRQWLLGGGAQTSLLLSTYIFRLADHILGTRLSVYGWALYFGNSSAPADCKAWTNVCILCGAGHSSDWLVNQGAVRRYLIISAYRCPNCKTVNLFTRD